jgi:hypothetical protein
MPVDVLVPTCKSLSSEGLVSFGLWLGRKVEIHPVGGQVHETAPKKSFAAILTPSGLRPPANR